MEKRLERKKVNLIPAETQCIIVFPHSGSFVDTSPVLFDPTWGVEYPWFARIDGQAIFVLSLLWVPIFDLLWSGSVIDGSSRSLCGEFFSTPRDSPFQWLVIRISFGLEITSNYVLLRQILIPFSTFFGPVSSTHCKSSKQHYHKKFSCQSTLIQGYRQ